MLQQLGAPKAADSIKKNIADQHPDKTDGKDQPAGRPQTGVGGHPNPGTNGRQLLRNGNANTGGNQARQRYYKGPKVANIWHWAVSSRKWLLRTSSSNEIFG